LVRGPVIGAGMEMTARARGLSIAANLHVPEQCLAQNDQGVTVCHIRCEIRFRYDDTLERRNGIVSAVTISATTLRRDKHGRSQDGAAHDD
jgi:hypothetical protein